MEERRGEIIALFSCGASFDSARLLPRSALSAHGYGRDLTSRAAWMTGTGATRCGPVRVARWKQGVGRGGVECIFDIPSRSTARWIAVSRARVVL